MAWNPFRFGLAILLLLSGLGLEARAGLMGVSNFNGGPRVDVELDLGTGPKMIKTRAGSFTTKVTGDKERVDLTYCVDLLTVASNTKFELDLVKVDSGAFGRAAWLFNEYAETNETLSGKPGRRARAALQIAIWEVVYDTDGVVNSGSIISFDRISTKVLDLTQAYLDASLAAGGGSLATGRGLLIDYEQEGSRPQDQITAIPEPGSLGLLGLGMAGLAAVVSHRRRRAEVGYP